MGLFDKVKNILFEEEEVEEEVVKEEKPQNIYPEKKKEVKEEPIYRPFVTEEKEEVKVKEPKFERVENNDLSERDLFKSDSTFKFPAFDEDEFNTSMPKVAENKSSNIMDYERRKKVDSFQDHPRYNRDKSYELPQKEEKKRFKPTPVISPVYGILDKDYKVDDIKEAPKVDHNIITSKDLDVDSVRAKAFGKLSDDIIKSERVNKSINSFKTENTIKEDKKEVEPIIEDTHKLMEERAKTIDELLKSAADDIVEVEKELDSVDIKDDIKDDINDIEFTDYNAVEDEIDNAFNEDVIVNDEKDALEDTLENDLYDLIDSMYENSEEGE